MSKIALLTDEVIYSYSKDNVLTDPGDIDLKIKTRIAPYYKGVYDQDIFGSIFSDRCNCGAIRNPGIKCPRCGSEILTQDESFKRFARIELPVFYLNKFKFKKAYQFIKDNFNVVQELNGIFKGYSWRDPIVLDICQWKYDEENNKLIITDDITDFMKCSFEGLLGIIKTYFPESLNEFKSYVNKYILVTPMILRAPSIRVEGDVRKLENAYATVVYKNIIYCVEEYYKNTFQHMTSELDKACFRGALRKLVSSSIDQLSQLFNSSKQNLARMMQSNRMSNSGRCTIVPDPSLKADEVKIPVHLMYEACRSEFIEYISNKKGIDIKQAEIIYKTQSDLDEVQNMFKEYIEGDPNKPETAKHVIINRAPTLYDYGMFSCKVILTNDYTMKIPQVLCKPTNGDFDGDTFSYYAIPKKMNNMINEALSAKNRFYYKKNHKPLFTPTAEMMRGLIQATKVHTPKEIQVFDTLEDAKEYKKNNRDFKYQTLCRIDGEQTTLARAILSDLFDKDINAYVGGLTKGLTAGNVTMLYEQLHEKEDRLDRIQKIQEFSLLITTLSGASSIKISDLYLDIDKSYIEKIRALENNNQLEDRVKELKIREIFYEYQKTQLEKIPNEVKMTINESQHAKAEELRDMAIQQLNVGPNHEYYVSETTLSGGMSPLDYIRHAVENRGTQDIKQLAVPQSGYVTRQFTYLASEYRLIEGEDISNPGILIPKKDAEFRTSVTGEIIPRDSSDELIRVRSIVSSNIGPGCITKDMLPNIFKFTYGSKVGMNLISSLTEQITQGGLALKHSGRLFNLQLDDALIAPDNGTLELTEDRVILHCESRSYVWPKGNEFVLNYMNEANEYKKGEVLGRDYHPVTPAYVSDCIIKLCAAKSVNVKKKFENNKKILSDCYCIEDGIITYDRDEHGNTIVKIGSYEYEYNPDSIYFFPEGASVKKLDRICSGTLDVNSMLHKVGDYIDFYYMFRKQVKELLSVTDYLIEFLYVLIVHAGDSGELEYRSVLKNIYGSESFFKSLAFGDARKSFQKIGHEGLEFVPDPITDVVLNLILNDNIG